MSVYMITYFLSDTHGHNHDESCGCGGHDHDHNEDCGCGHDHDHSHSVGDANIVGKIKSLGAWAQYMPEGFFVKAELSAEEIYDEVSSVANKGDIIFVTEINSKTSACGNPAVLDWLSK